MYVAIVPNRNSPPASPLREGYRQDGKVKSRTLANLSHWPLAKIDRLRRVLRDEVLSGTAERLTMLRSLPHGHVAAVLGSARKIGLDRLLAAGQAPARLAALVLAMIVARVLDPASKLATARRGYSRDGKPDKLQIVFGLLCASDGCPVAVEVFESLPRRRPGATWAI